MTKVIKIYESKPNERHLTQVCDALKCGGIIIVPTDSYYAYGCAISNIKAINKIKNIKGKKNDDLSLICSSISMAAEYSKIDNRQYKILRDNTPDAITFILQPSSSLPNKFMESKKSVGIRVTSSSIARAIVEMLGEPLACSSITMEELDEQDRGCSSLIFDEHGSKVDLFVDGDDILAEQTTVVDIRDSEPIIIREGAVELKF